MDQLILLDKNQRPRTRNGHGTADMDQPTLETYTSFISGMKFYSLVYLVPDLTEERKSLRDGFQRYLDSFAHMADYEKAGQTTTAIAIQDESDTPVYRIAANNVVNDVTISHLTEILHKLQCLHTANTQIESGLIEASIAEQSILFCRKKVKNYCNRLCTSVKAILKSVANSTSVIADDRVQLLETWEIPLEDPVQVCELAREYATSETIKTLAADYPHGRDTLLPWFQVHHYIRRLGSWHKAARILVSFARRQRSILLNASIEPIGRMSALQPNTPKPLILDTLRNVMPDFDPDTTFKICEKLRQNASGTLEEHFEGVMACSGTCAHCESAIAEYFYQQDFKFFHNKPYIGCSKPSCYCCSLFLRHHPGEFVPRPRHGNVWPKWLWPQFEEHRHNHIFNTLKKMVKELHRDINTRMSSEGLWNGRKPDSMTYNTRTLTTSWR